MCRRRRRRGEREAHALALGRHLDRLDLLEHLDPALDLTGLGRLVPEPLDEPLGLGPGLGLARGLGLELADPLLALHDELGEPADVLGEGLVGELDDVRGDSPQLQAMLPMTQFVKLSMRGMDDGARPDTLAPLARQLKGDGKQLVAEKVETREEFAACLNLGFDYFQGYYFARPVILSGKKIAPSQMAIMHLLDLLASDADQRDIERATVHQRLLDAHQRLGCAVHSDAANPPVHQLLLEQRAKFLRPDSLLAVVVLSDENDASLKPAGLNWLPWGYGKGQMQRGWAGCDNVPDDFEPETTTDFADAEVLVAWANTPDNLADAAARVHVHHSPVPELALGSVARGPATVPQLAYDVRATGDTGAVGESRKLRVG